MKYIAIIACLILCACAGRITDEDLRRDEIDAQKAKIEKIMEQNECAPQQSCIVN